MNTINGDCSNLHISVNQCHQKYTQHTSTYGVRAKQSLISFKTAAHCRNLNFIFSIYDLGTSRCEETLETYVKNDSVCQIKMKV